MAARETIQRVPVLLASASRARAEMLRAAGLEITVAPVAVDEAALRRRLEGHEPTSIALALAEAKAAAACEGGRARDGAFVVAADQILVCGGRILDKRPDPAAAIALLKELSGRSHALVTATVLARDGAICWRGVDRAELQMRKLSDDFLAWYAAAAGDALTACVGCYEIEGVGIQLMERVSGDIFTIRGLVLLPLLAALRRHGALAS